MSHPGAPDPRLRRRFFRLTFYNILANLTVPLVGLVDTAMLGHLEDIRFLAGVALAAVLFDYLYWTFGFLRMGTTGMTAQAVGRGDTEGEFRVLYQSTLLALGIAAVLLVFMAPLREAGFWLLSGAESVEDAGRDYFNARILGAPATLINFALLGWFLGREQSGRVLAMTVTGNGCNVLLDYLFILKWGWAAWGAGLATAISQAVMLALGVALFLASGPRPRLPWRSIAHRAALGRLLSLNADILVRTLCLETAFALFTNFSAMLGTAVLAANAILLRLLNLAAYFVDGAAFATESLAGIYFGRGDRASLRRLLRTSLFTAWAFAGAFLAVLAAAPRGWLSLLTSHPEVLELALRYAPWLLPVLAFGAVAYTYDGLFLGLTRGRTLRNAMILSLLAGFVPWAAAAWLLERPEGLWLALMVFMAARGATLHVASRRLGASPGPEAPAASGM